MTPDRPSSAGKRAQSESVGVILLTAVIVILVGGFGVVYLGTLDGGGQGPLVDASVDATAEQFSITHGGGESVPIDELEVVVRDDASERYAVDPGNVSGPDDGTFDPGDRYRCDHGLGTGSMEVLLIHTASNAVVHEAHLDTSGRNAVVGRPTTGGDPRALAVGADRRP